MNYGPPEAWGGVVPVRGSLSFDFVSAAPIPEGAEAIGADMWRYACIAGPISSDVVGTSPDEQVA
jgi:hypothetical protein